MDMTIVSIIAVIIVSLIVGYEVQVETNKQLKENSHYNITETTVPVHDLPMTTSKIIQYMMILSCFVLVGMVVFYFLLKRRKQ